MNVPDPILEMYVYESAQMIELTESVILDCESAGTFSPEAINEIFRNMHTLKGSSAMMQHMHIADAAHAVEDLFHLLREQPPSKENFKLLSNLVLRSVDFFKEELQKISANEPADGSSSGLIASIQAYLNGALAEPQAEAGQTAAQDDPLFIYHAIIHFTDDCEMVNIRAYQLTHQLKDKVEHLYYEPADLFETDNSVRDIKDRGFHLIMKSYLAYEQMHAFLSNTSYLEHLELQSLDEWLIEGEDTSEAQEEVAAADSSYEEAGTSDGGYGIGSDASRVESISSIPETSVQSTQKEPGIRSLSQSQMISVHVEKLDRLMDLVGELVIAEAMVSNSERSHSSNNDSQLLKASGQLRKITSELQDTVMSIRMIPLTATFHKMRRVARDMSHKLGKDIQFTIIGEETEIDKSVIDQISDPLMHLVRNAIDHGIESTEERLSAGKPAEGFVTLEAKHIGSDVLVVVKDDGIGLNREKIIAKAIKNGLLDATNSDLSDRDAYNLIFKPGLSTQEQITEFSGRGVGMDVVASNIEQVGGVIYVDSEPGKGTTITMKIPLTLAIIDGMNVRVQDAFYTLPTTSIKESFRPAYKDLFTDPDGNHMVMVRKEIYSILSLQERFHGLGQPLDFTKGVLIMVEQDGKNICLFADELIGQQQIVIKPLPAYFRKLNRSSGLAGCTLLSDGSISLILNMADLVGVSHSAGTNYTF